MCTSWVCSFYLQIISKNDHLNFSVCLILKGNEILAQTFNRRDFLKIRKLTSGRSQEEKTQLWREAVVAGGGGFICDPVRTRFCPQPKVLRLPIIYSRINSPSRCCGIYFSCPRAANTRRPRPPQNRWSPLHFSSWIAIITYCFLYLW